MEGNWTIWLPTRPQVDTIAAILLLHVFGKEKFPGIEKGRVEIQGILPTADFENLLTQHILALDIGGGPLDHHGKNKCTTELVAEYLGVATDPSLQQLLQWTRRDDKEGKGTLSKDALDRAFGMAGLISALNKANPKDPQKVVDAALPLLEAHLESAREHYVVLPKDVERKLECGECEAFEARQGNRILKGMYVVSDKSSMPTYLRSERGGTYDVVVQKTEQSGHVSVLTKQARSVNLSGAAALIRLREGELRGLELGSDASVLGAPGRHADVPMWYVDPATNSLLNGGVHSAMTEPTRIPWEEMKKIVKAGLEISAEIAPASASSKKSSYYLSINIPRDTASDILSSLSASDAIKIHGPDNLHVTLHYFGEKTADEAAEIARQAETALKEVAPFSIVLSDSQLAFGSPEGYTNTEAWYLSMDGHEGAEQVQALRASVLPTVGVEVKPKELHITLAAKRNVKDSVSAGAGGAPPAGLGAGGQLGQRRNRRLAASVHDPVSFP